MRLSELACQLQSLANAVAYLPPGHELSEEQAQRVDDALARIRVVLIETRRESEPGA